MQAQGLRERKQQLEALVRKRVAEGWGVHVAGYPQPARGAQIQHDFILRVLSCALPKQGYCSEAIDMWEAHEAFAYSRTRIFTPQSQVHDKVVLLAAMMTCVDHGATYALNYGAEQALTGI